MVGPDLAIGKASATTCRDASMVECPTPPVVARVHVGYGISEEAARLKGFSGTSFGDPPSTSPKRGMATLRIVHAAAMHLLLGKGCQATALRELEMSPKHVI